MNTLSVEFNQSLFNLSDPKKSFISPENQNILKQLQTGIKKKKKLFLVTGEKNCGKTTLVQRAISEIETKTLLVNIHHDNLSYEELIDYTGNKLDDNFTTETSLEIKSAHLKSLVKTESIKQVIFLIDQSLKIQPAILVDTLKLVNSTLFGSCSSHLIITGLNDLETNLKNSKLTALSIIDSTLLQVQPLLENDIRSYIKFHLKHLKEKGEDLFSEAALKRIIFYSKGLPGLINRLCNLGLLTANIEEKSIVTEEMMNEVLENSLFLGNEFNYSPDQIIDSSEPEAASSFLPPSNKTEFSTQSKEEDIKSIVEDVFKSKVQKPLNENAFESKPQKQKPAVEDAFSVPNLIKSEAALETETEDFIEQITPPSKPHHDSKVIKIKKRKVAHSKPKSSVFVTAFILGMLTAALIGIGWNFWGQKDYSISKADIKTTASQQQSEDNLPQKKHPEEEETIFLSSDNKEESTQITENKVTQVSIAEKTTDSIEELLQLANQQYTSKKLMTPIEDSAWSTYKKILEIDPGNQQAQSGIFQIKETYINWSRLEIDKGNISNAVSLLNKALQISPDDPKVLDILLEIKNTGLTEKPKYIPKVGENYSKLIDEPNGISKLLILAEQQIAKKNLTKPINNSALSIYQLILARYPTQQEAKMGIKKIKDTYISWAKHEIKQGDFSHAEFLYTKALEVAPSDPEALSELDQLRQTTGKF